MLEKYITARVSRRLYESIAQTARSEGRTMSNLVRLILEQAVCDSNPKEQVVEREDSGDGC